MADVFQIVTDRIIAEMEAGVIPWHKPWCSVNDGAFNRITGRRYSLLNQLILSRSGEYASFAQWTKLGGHIRKGAKSELVVFWQWPERPDSCRENTIPNPSTDDIPDSASPDPAKVHHPILKYYRVFHVSQIDGVDPLPVKQLPFDHEPIEAADTLFRDYVKREGIHVIQKPSNEAYYSPSNDRIHLPDIRQYEYVEEFYSTAFHEAVHSSGHDKRLSRFREGKVAFGSETYSKEELVAEIGSAALLNLVGIESDISIRNSAAYIQNWLSILKNDRRFIISAATQAEKAVRYIAGDGFVSV